MKSLLQRCGFHKRSEAVNFSTAAPQRKQKHPAAPLRQIMTNNLNKPLSAAHLANFGRFLPLMSRLCEFQTFPSLYRPFPVQDLPCASGCAPRKITGPLPCLLQSPHRQQHQATIPSLSIDAFRSCGPLLVDFLGLVVAICSRQSPTAGLSPGLR